MEQSREIRILEEKIGQRERECEWVSEWVRDALVSKHERNDVACMDGASLSLSIPMPYPFVRDRFCCGRAGLEVWHKEYHLYYLVTYWGPDKFVCDFVGTMQRLWPLKTLKHVLFASKILSTNEVWFSWEPSPI